MDQRIGVPMTEPQFALEIVTDLAVLAQSAFPDDVSQLLEGPACLLLNIAQLGLSCFVHRAHLLLSFLEHPLPGAQNKTDQRKVHCEKSTIDEDIFPRSTLKQGNDRKAQGGPAKTCHAHPLEKMPGCRRSPG